MSCKLITAARRRCPYIVVLVALLLLNAAPLRQTPLRAAPPQIAPPRALRAAVIEGDAVELAWAPVANTVVDGFYEVSYATAFDGPYTVHGRTADLASSGYRLTGLAPGTSYFIQVQTVMPPNAGSPVEVRSPATQTVVVTRTNETILLIVFFPADNDLDPYVPAVRERLRVGTQHNPNARVVLLSDRSGLGDTEVVTIADGVVTATDAVAARSVSGELDTADPEVLGWFLRYARDSFPADREIVALMGHGLALAPEIEWAETAQPTGATTTRAAVATAGRIPPLPKGLDPTPGDVTDSGYMSTVDLGRALALATDDGADPFDLLFLDQCFQGNLDTLYELRSAADFFIASPNYAWLAAPYDQYLALLAPASTTEQLAGAIMARYQRNLNDRHPNVIFGLRRADIEAVAVAVSALGEALARAVQAGDKHKIAIAAFESPYVDTTQCGRQNLTLDPPDELLGAGGFAANLYAAYDAGDPAGVHAAAEAVLAALEPIHKRTRVGRPYLAPGELWDYQNTLTILAPLPPDSPAAVAWRSSIYTETVPLTAVWTPVPIMTVQVTASFAYVRDGSWDEFIAGWYDAPLAPTVGEWCHYIPPAIAGDEALEPLSLTASQAGADGLRLSWTPATHEDAAEYWLYVWEPSRVSWVARRSLPIGQTSGVIAGLSPEGRSRLMVVAQDAAGIALAQSNEVVWPALARRVYLPLIHGRIEPRTASGL